MEYTTSIIPIIPLQGGAITSKEKIAIPHGGFSMIQNFDPRYPGFEQRKGCAKHHTTADPDSLETQTIWQYNKGSKVERHTYRQLLDGSVQEATDNPPTVTTGAFGSDVLTAISGSIPASWGNMNDLAIFSDGARQHQIYGGTDRKVGAFFVGGTGTIGVSDGEDGTRNVTDGLASTTAVVGSNTTHFVMTDLPATSIKYTIGTANTVAATVTIYYWDKTTNAWATLGTITDGTLVSGATSAQNGSRSWTAPTNERATYLFGQSGFWYKTVASASLSATASVSDVAFNAPFQSIQNVFDGVFVDAIEAKIWDSTQLRYYQYSADSIDVSMLPAGDYIYFNTIEPIMAAYIDVGATPHVKKATITGTTNISFLKGGTTSGTTTYGSILTTNADFLAAGFEEGQSIVITGTTSNNVTTKIIAVSSKMISVPSNILADEANKSATITYTGTTPSLAGFDAWTGSGWTDCMGADGTGGLIQAGYMPLATIPSTQPTDFAQSAYHSRWYRFKYGHAISRSVNIGIQVIPYYDVEDLGKVGVANGVWKNHALYTFSDYPEYLYVSAAGNPLMLNGDGYDILEAGTGRNNRNRCVKTFHNEIIIWQEEKGGDGGVTLFEGYSNATFGRLLLTPQIGILNVKSAVVLDGILTSTETESKIKTLAFWLSHYGVFVTDGRIVSFASSDIQNYFNPMKDECIRAGYEDKMWIAHDSARNAIRMGLVSGSSATVPNIFPVFHLTDASWTFDKLTQGLSCMAEVEAASGAVFSLQYGGGSSDGFVYRLNTGLNDVSTAINAYIDQEIDGGGNYLQLRDTVLRGKSQAAGDITQSFALAGNSTFETSPTKTFSMVAAISGDPYWRDRWRASLRSNHFTVRFAHNTVSESSFLLDVGYRLKPEDNNR